MEWTERQKELRHMIHEAVGEFPVNKMNYEGYGGHDVTLGVRLPNRCHPSVNWDVDDGHFLIEDAVASGCKGRRNLRDAFHEFGKRVVSRTEARLQEEQAFVGCLETLMKMEQMR